MSCLLRAVGPQDAGAVEAFLLPRAPEAMFPLANLRTHGVAGDPEGPPHAMQVWIAGAPGLPVEGVIGLTVAGMLLPQWPALERGPGGPALAALCLALAGARVSGAVGPAAQVRALLSALGLAGVGCRRNVDEPGFALDLCDLVVPDGPGALRRVVRDDFGWLCGWRAAYHGEVLGTPADKAGAEAARDLEGYLARDSHRVLWDGDRPLAFTGFNATLPEIVQVGGVYTPPARRGRGLARRALALHLREAREQGVARAVLFAASEAAARAYRAVGFRPATPFALVLFERVEVVRVEVLGVEVER